MQINRRSTFSLALLAILPARVWAEDRYCSPLVAGLSHCDAVGWTLDRSDAGVALMTHMSGITASVSLRTGLSDQDMMWENWQQSHAPISARAEVLVVDWTSIDGRNATSAAYLPRHSVPPAVVVLTGHVAAGVALRVTTQEIARSYTDLHRSVHADLLAALKLDLPE
ncbi:hypothetical protein [Tabrizicola sp.]|uniref:hypothetical protein n=1 Tax=Tabrizicola sp. TaxID=2005166 RepID=UPI00286B2225|nr:hypothetical protein [Tabrizicola sp.]